MIKYDYPWLEQNETLICFGDSITDTPNSYVDIIREKLATHKIEVINAGHGGDNTPKAYTRLQRDVIDKKPDAVSIFLGTNDAGCGRGRWADEPRLSSQTYRDNLIWMAHLCKMAGIEKFSITPPLWRYEGDDWAEFADILMPYRLAAREAADEIRARFVPADIAFEREWARHPGHTDLLLTVDGVHPSEKGHQIIAETTLKAWVMGT